MDDVTQRFLDIYKYLKKNKMVRTQKEFSDLIGIASTTFSEFVGDRSGVGGKTLQKVIKKYNINPEWLFYGKGNMFADENTENSNNTVNEPEETYGGDVFMLLKQRFTIIERKLNILQSDFEDLKKQIGKE